MHELNISSFSPQNHPHSEMMLKNNIKYRPLFLILSSKFLSKTLSKLYLGKSEVLNYHEIKKYYFLIQIAAYWMEICQVGNLSHGNLYHTSSSSSQSSSRDRLCLKKLLEKVSK